MDDNKAQYSLIKMRICFLFIVLLAADSDSDRAIFRAETLDFSTNCGSDSKPSFRFNA